MCISERMEDMMDKHQILKECAENLALLTQLGLSVAVPPLLCLYAADWLRNRLNLGLWIMVIALLLGLGALYVLSVVTNAERNSTGNEPGAGEF